MKMINIVPVHCLHLTQNQPMGMFLAHLVDRFPHYKYFASAYKGYKILDNSIVELGEAVDMEFLVEMAGSIGANEIILPDIFDDGPATVELVRECIVYLEKRGLANKYKIMAVCQGKDIKEFQECFYTLNGITRLGAIGIPKRSAKLHPAGRAGFEYLWTTAGVPIYKDIHLLGIYYSFSELADFKYPDIIRSVDSVMSAYLSYYSKGNVNPYGVRPDGHTLPLDDTSIVLDLDRFFKINKTFVSERGEIIIP